MVVLLLVTSNYLGLFNILNDIFIVSVIGCCSLSDIFVITSPVLERPSPAKKGQQRPEKLTVAFQMQNSSLQGVFSWQLSQAVPGQDPVTGFQLSWVPVSGAGGTSATLNTPVSQTQFVPPVSSTVKENLFETICQAWMSQVLFSG